MTVAEKILDVWSDFGQKTLPLYVIAYERHRRFKLRLAVVTHVVRENDGQGRVNLEVVLEALARGWSVMIFSAELTADLQKHPKVTWVKISYGPLPSSLLRYQVFAINSYLAVSKRRSQFDILHVNGFITWGHADVNAVHFVHNGWFNSGYFPYKASDGAKALYQVVYTRVNAFLERHALRRARTIIAVSNRVAHELRETGVGGEMDVIYNGVGLERFADVAPNRARFSLPEDKFLLLFVGDIKTRRKNLESVLRAMPMLPENISLAVAGETKGSLAPQLARDLGIEERVHFLGQVRDIPVLMRSTDIFVFPSRYDPCPLVIPEAMAAGMPVVTSVRAGSSELLEGAGIVLDDPDNVDRLAAAILSIYDNSDLRTSMKELAVSGAAKNSWTAMARKYLAVYERTFQEKLRAVPVPKR